MRARWWLAKDKDLEYAKTTLRDTRANGMTTSTKDMAYYI